MKQRFNITGMTCASCAGNVEKAVKDLPGMKSSVVNLMQNYLQVEYSEGETTSEDIMKAVENGCDVVDTAMSPLADGTSHSPTESIVAFESLEGDTYAINSEGKHLSIDYTLEDLHDLLDPAIFFRVNRKYIVSLQAIESTTVWSGSRLKVNIKNLPNHEILVSRERVSDFRAWLEN